MSLSEEAIHVFRELNPWWVSRRGHGSQVHFYRDYEEPNNRRSRIREVDFVAERVDGAVVPIEVKYRKRIDADDIDSVVHFMKKFGSRLGVLVPHAHFGGATEPE